MIDCSGRCFEALLISVRILYPYRLDCVAVEG